MQSPRATNPKQQVDNEELLVGDIVVLLCFCTVKQIDAIVTDPGFPGTLGVTSGDVHRRREKRRESEMCCYARCSYPRILARPCIAGWTAPLEFRYERWIEFCSFLCATVGTFTSVSFLTGGYSKSQSGSLKLLIENCSFVTVISSLLLAAQLVIGVASENASFVGVEGWNDVLPLAARGLGEPWVSAVQLLGVTVGWRVIWYFFVDTSSFLTLERMNRYRETERGVLVDAATITGVLAIVSFVVLRILEAQEGLML